MRYGPKPAREIPRSALPTLFLLLGLLGCGPDTPMPTSPALSPDPVEEPTTRPTAGPEDADDDGYEGGTSGTDCDDGNNAIHPDAQEIPYDGIDQDCTGNDLTDVDTDGYDSTAAGGDDCDDDNIAIHPDAQEVPYDGIDQDCLDADLIDVDEDGFPATQAGGTDCDDTNTAVNPATQEIPYDGIDQDCDGADPTDLDLDGADGGPEGIDCDDTNAAINPSAQEIPYDGIDQDCSGTDLTDVDQDAYNSTAAGGDDCDDHDEDTHPGATELEDDRDNDCDGQIDEDLDTNDDDGDGYSEATGDCDDTLSSVHPDGHEIPYDGIDQDCQGGDLIDVDKDTYVATKVGGDDCDDTDRSIHPDAPETPYDGIDQDCQEGDLIDVDNDGYAATQAGGGDCDDENSAIHPDAQEIPYDGIDQDCSGAELVDVDGDGQTATQVGGTDCNDGDVTIYFGAIEVPYDGIDQDCSGADLTDVDGDTYPATQVGGTDCDDTSASTYPGAPEFEDDKDNDCDGQIDEDLDTNDDDGDSFTEASGDCNDALNTVYPGATEIPYDGIDQDCSGLDLTDVDGDGFAGGTGPDCNDNDLNINPAAEDIPYDGIDQDCSSADLTDVDQDGFDAEAVGGNDCDDTTGLIHPGATEVPYDAIDQDCDDQDLVDVDQDGFIATQAGGADCNDYAQAITPEATELCDGIDNNCDKVVDTDAVDRTLWYIDSDGDTYGDPESGSLECSPASNQVSNALDCNDASSSSYPDAVETCDTLDNNCDGTVDEQLTVTYYLDSDADGYGDALSSVDACTAPAGYVEDDTDCDDSDTAVKPVAAEVCDTQNVDENCNGSADDQDATTDLSTRSRYYRDVDGDGYGDPASSTLSCDLPAGYVIDGKDCAPSDASIHPDATEVTGDAIDQNCDGKEVCYLDADNDGYRPDSISTVSSSDTDCADASEAADTDSAGDCDDTDATIHPNASEPVGDSVDEDCNGEETCFKDADNDGYRPDTSATVRSTDADCADSGEAVSTDLTGDCNDSDASVKPGATELCNSIDDNCNSQVDEGAKTTYYQDADGDQYGNPSVSVQACSAPTGHVTNASDCNDSDTTIKPGAVEVTGDSKDQNCDGKETCYKDGDNDGYRPDNTATVASNNTDCLDANEAVSTDPTGDCNDGSNTTYPGAPELCNSIDDNCNGLVDDNAELTWYKDSDKDGYGTPLITAAGCSQPTGYVTKSGDCNDADSTINPGATEGVGDSKDQNCDGLETCYTDADDDGYRPDSASTKPSTDTDCTDPFEASKSDPTGDCIDSNALINPGKTETCNTIDDNCNGVVDENVTNTYYRDQDSDGYGVSSSTTLGCTAPTGYVTVGGDCNDSDATIKPGAAEVAGDSKDQNCDGKESCFQDSDNDGYRPDSTSTVASSDTDCLDPNEAVSTDPAGDCNDGSSAIKPGATEGVGDSIDQNCDGLETCFKDADNDGYRPDATSTVASTNSNCTDANEAVSSDPTTDCNDSDALINPGKTETCNGIDDNCNGSIDENAKTTYYLDGDKDGYGISSSTTQACSQPTGYASKSGDCNDSDALSYPGASELCDGKDNDCNGSVPSTESDSDADSYRICSGDCNDAKAAIKPGVDELIGDSVDQNCDGKEVCYQDSDNDGYRPDATSITSSSNSDCADANEALKTDPTGDCNDTVATTYPGAPDYPLDGVDSSCDAVEPTILDVAAGYSVSYVLMSDGYVWATGSNGYGALGNGTNTSSTVPVRVQGLKDVVKIAAGYDHGMAMTSSGKVYCWGYGGYGQLGQANYNSYNTPQEVVNLSDLQVVDISAGNYHSLAALSDGRVVAWGYGGNGQLGNGGTQNSTVPTLVSNVVDAVAVSGGQNYSMALRRDGSLLAWGYGGNGQLGNGSGSSSTVPVSVLGLSNVTEFDCGEVLSLAVMGGEVYAWGNGYGGTPTKVAGVSSALQVSAGYNFAIARTGTGLYAWGFENSYGQLGDDTTTYHTNPMLVAGLPAGESVSAGSSHVLFVGKDGKSYAWGNNNNGQLGVGLLPYKTSPSPVPVPAQLKAVAAGSSQLLLLDTNGRVYAAGHNYYGQLGLGNTASFSTAQPVTFPTGVVIQSIAAGDEFSIALSTSGKVYAWGAGDWGQLGNGGTINSSTPVLVQGLDLVTVTMIAAGQSHAMAVTSTGKLYVWGANYNGQLGDGTTSQRQVAIWNPNISSVAAIAAGGSHSMALTTAGQLYTWGKNSNGQLGNGTTTQQLTPTLITLPQGAVAKSLAAGRSFSMALTTTGTILAWGYGGYGQLGNGSNSDKLTPVSVTGMSSVVGIAAGYYHSLAATTDGSVYTWGSGDYGATGLGTTSSTSSPTRVSGLQTSGTPWLSEDRGLLTGGYSFSSAITSTGSGVSFGYNSDGRLAIGEDTWVPILMRWGN